MIDIPVHQLKKMVIQEGLIEERVFDEIVIDAERLKENMVDALVSRNIVALEYLYQIFSRYFNIPIANISKDKLNEHVLHLLPESLAKQKKVILFGEEIDGSLSVAMEDPTNLETIEFIKQFTGRDIKPYFATEKDLYKGFVFYGKKQSEDHRKLIEQSVVESLKLGRKGEGAAVDAPIIAILDNIIAYAAHLKASDIHIEIFEDEVLVRYRIDGILQEVMKIPKIIHSAIVARIKILGGLKIDEHYRPQDGRFRYSMGLDIFDVRISIMPTFHGEKAEMRLLTAAQRPLSFQEVGIFDDMVNILNANISKSYGMALVCGPTGSGKTTTLYSVLNILNRSAVNIVTIEDPIEYNIKYINQTQINPVAGVTFANGLRAILRQDPNIVFVGEIRDGETASIAVQAALTGHMVLSSIHTNDAASAVPRLMDMNVPAFLIAAVLNAVIAQRLVRKICLDCIYSFVPDVLSIDTLKQQMQVLKLENKFNPPRFLYAGKGCPSCNNTGYRGRIGIFEIINMSESIRKEIISSDFSLDNMQRIAREEGMITMFEDGIRKAEKGLTTIEEILRVIRA